MDIQNKINIYVPEKTAIQLRNDALLFEIFKADGKTINMNGFLTMLFRAHHDDFRMEDKRVLDSIQNELSKVNIPLQDQQELARNVLSIIFLPSNNKDAKENKAVLSFKPTSKTEYIISDFIKEYSSESVSQVLRRVLMNYCKEPIYERERIIFKDAYVKLITACKEKRSIIFTLKYENGKRHEVMPYEVAISKEEMFNYLICDEINTENSQHRVKCFRLSRIMNVRNGSRTKAIPADIKEKCERTIKIAPQYAINDDAEICVRLNEAGIKLYNRIYHGRPPCDRTDSEDNYYFSCSEDQAFHYFRRFDNSTATIIYPESLRKRMIEFHRNAILQYENT